MTTPTKPRLRRALWIFGTVWAMAILFIAVRAFVPL